MTELEGYAEALREDVGETLRGVAIADLRAREFDVIYMREDIWQLYSDETQQEIFEDAVFETMGMDRKEDLFEPLGGLEATVRVFEGGINVLAWADDHGVFVGLGPDEDAIPAAVRTANEIRETL
ncbi:hypothetical protein [Salarchaeum japonicum]|uniref:Uncharacterized protein n=1 Tax=Salarchaeum japonicum TaxID=555573 RepID=A0AAV3T2W5_9EURY|nr:hypothetical protein [Salarchaeum japonicum]